MEGFVPEKPSLLARLGTPLTFVVLGVLAGGLAYYFYSKMPGNGAPNDIPPAPEVQATPANAPSPQQVARTQEAQKVPALSKMAEAPKALALNRPTSGPLPPGTSAGEAQPRSSADGRGEPSGVAIEFILASRDVMERLTQEGDGHVDIGRYSLSVVPQFKAKYDSVRADGGFHELASESRNLALNQPSLVFRGGKDPKNNETIGFYVEVTPSRQTERGTEYKISIKRSLPDVAPTGEVKISTQAFDESVVVPHNGAVVIAGLLPRKQQLLEGEDELYKGNILKALLDPGFEKGDEEFLIVVNPHFSEPTN